MSERQTDFEPSPGQPTVTPDDNDNQSAADRVPSFGEQDQRQFAALSAMQGQFLEQMESLFAVDSDLQSLAECLTIARQHRSQWHTINSLSEYSRQHGGKGLGRWRPGKYDLDPVLAGNPLGLIVGGELCKFDSPLHGLVHGAVALCRFISPPHELTIGDMFLRLFRHHQYDQERSPAPVAARNTVRYLGNLCGQGDWITLADMPCQLMQASECGERLGWFLQAASIQRNGGIDPLSTHEHFYRIAAETACAEIDIDYLDLHFRVLAETRFPDLHDILPD